MLNQARTSAGPIKRIFSFRLHVYKIIIIPMLIYSHDRGRIQTNIREAKLVKDRRGKKVKEDISC